MRKTLSALSSMGMLESSSGWLLSQRSAGFCRSLLREPYGSNQIFRVQQRPSTPTSRLFGAKVGSTTIPGKIYLEDAQSALGNIDVQRLETTVSKIRDLIGYSTYDVSLYLIDDEDMQEANKESRSVDAPTDILSFPFLNTIEPGQLEAPPFDVPDYYNLGEMLVDVRYVMRICDEDKAVAKEMEEGVEYEEDGEEDRGVSKAMSTVFDPEERIHMLLVHGMLHLVGHDHEEDDQYELMVAKEEELLKTLQLVP